MKSLLFLTLLPGLLFAAPATPPTDRLPQTADTLVPGKPRKPTQPAYEQAQPPVIMPGTQLDTNFRTLPAQHPSVARSAPAWLRRRVKGTPTYVINGQVATARQLKRLRQASVVSITQLDGQKASSLYGPNARRGLLLITTRTELH
ncbi:hypothetical protein GCM10027578_11810 [Spirosoma luteolum]